MRGLGRARAVALVKAGAVSALVMAAGVIASGAQAGSVGPTDACCPSVSASGRFVAFETGADLGGPVNPAAESNVYVFDRENNRLQLISRRSKSAGGGGANGFSGAVALSATGRYAAFWSSATNLSDDDVAVYDIYVYDRKRKRVELVSRRSRTAGGQAADSDSQRDPTISADGSVVGFITTAGNLGGPIDPATTYNVYAYDRERKRVELISRRSKAAGGAGADGDSGWPSLSATGRFVAFGTGADNLGGPTQNPTGNIYVYDRARKRVTLVSRQSRAAGGQGADDNANSPAITPDGRFVAFNTTAENLGGPIDPGSTNKVYLYDRDRKRAALVSRQSKGAGGGGANGDSRGPAISRSGRHIAFETSADNLGGGAEPFYNVYAYDRRLRRVALISRQGNAAGGAPADDPSFWPTISGSGRIVAFQTTAENLGGPALADSNVYFFDRRERRVRLASRAP